MNSAIRIGEITMAASRSANVQYESVDVDDANAHALRNGFGRSRLPDFAVRGHLPAAVRSDRGQGLARLADHGRRPGNGRASLRGGAQPDPEHRTACKTKQHGKAVAEAELRLSHRGIT